jgi:hypothetical protein
MFNRKSMAAHLNRRTMLLSSSAGALGVLIGTSSPTQAATVPICQVGTFINANSRQYGHELAAAGLKQIGCTPTVWDDYLVTGYNSQVIVSITSVPLASRSTYMCVIACSSDSQVAEKARNDVRTFIQSHICSLTNEDCGIS